MHPQQIMQQYMINAKKQARFCHLLRPTPGNGTEEVDK